MRVSAAPAVAHLHMWNSSYALRLSDTSCECTLRVCLQDVLRLLHSMRDAEEYVASGRGDQFKAVHATHISQTHSHTRDSSQYCDDLLYLRGRVCRTAQRGVRSGMTLHSLHDTITRDNTRSGARRAPTLRSVIVICSSGCGPPPEKNQLPWISQISPPCCNEGPQRA